MVENYSTARLVLKIITVVGVITIVIGVITALGAFSQAQYYGGVWGRLLSMLPGVGIAVSGVFSIGFAQIGASMLDASAANQRSADYLKQLVEER